MHEPHEHEKDDEGCQAKQNAHPILRYVSGRRGVDIFPLPARPPWYARRVPKLRHLAMRFAEAGLCRQLAGEIQHDEAVARGPKQLPERLRIAVERPSSTRAPAFDKREVL